MTIENLLPGLSAIALLAVGSGILLRSRTNRSAIFMGLGLLSYCVSEASYYSMLQGFGFFEPVTWASLSMAFRASALPFWLLFSQQFARSGKDSAHTGKGLVWISSGVALVMFAMIGSPRFIPEVDLIGEKIYLGHAGFLFPVYSLLISVIILSNIEQTFKAADRRQRWHIKFTVLAVAGIFGSVIFLNSQTILFSAIDMQYVGLFSAMLILSSLMLVVSILRGGVPDVQIFVSGRVILQSITVLLVGVYLVITAFITYGIRLWGGPSNLFAGTLFVFVSLLALAIFLLSEDVRRRVRRFVYLNFFQREYDYREKWGEVTERFASKLTAADIDKTLLDILEATLGVNTLTSWHRSPDHDVYRLSDARGYSREAMAKIRPDPELIQRLQSRQEPLAVYELEKAEPTGPFWEFVKPRVIVPIFMGRDLLGFVTLGQKTNDDEYTYEDLDLLSTISKQAAGALQTARLSEQLLEAKEAESFHLLSTFFMHDLKNFASTLSLISENSIKRFDDPEFRADAIESIRRVTERIQEMLAKLSMVSKRITTENSLVDVSAMIQSVVEEVRPMFRVELSADLPDGLIIYADRHLLQNSVRNLILNANDAVNGRGGISLRAWREKDAVCLAVQDTGCGMSEAFLQTELFKPFRTTKPNGVGIGLFQVKKIVEAHGGKLHVVSREGVGTTVTVRLPNTNQSLEHAREAEAVNRR